MKKLVCQGKGLFSAANVYGPQGEGCAAVVGRIMAPQRCPCSTPQSPCVCWFTQGRIQVADVIESYIFLLVSQPWDAKIILVFLGEPSVISTTLECGGKRQKIQCPSNVTWERLDFAAGFEKWKEDTSHWMPATSRSWKRQENKLLPRASRKERSPVDTLIVCQWNPFQTSGLQNE